MHLYWRNYGLSNGDGACSSPCCVIIRRRNGRDNESVKCRPVFRRPFLSFFLFFFSFFLFSPGNPRVTTPRYDADAWKASPRVVAGSAARCPPEPVEPTVLKLVLQAFFSKACAMFLEGNILEF